MEDKVICIKVPKPKGQWADMLVLPKKDTEYSIRKVGKYSNGVEYYLLEEIENDIYSIKGVLLEPGFPVECFVRKKDWEEADKKYNELMEELSKEVLV